VKRREKEFPISNFSRYRFVLPRQAISNFQPARLTSTLKIQITGWAVGWRMKRTKRVTEWPTKFSFNVWGLIDYIWRSKAKSPA